MLGTEALSVENKRELRNKYAQDANRLHITLERNVCSAREEAIDVDQPDNRLE